MNRQVESGQIFPANFRVNGPETVSVLPVNIAFGKVFFFFFLITIFTAWDRCDTYLQWEV